MEAIRWAAVKNKLELLPLERGDQTMGAEEETGQRNYQSDNYIRWWAPTPSRVDPLPWGAPELGGRLIRYPAEVDSEECFTAGEESQQSDVEGKNGDTDMSGEVHTTTSTPRVMYSF